MIEPLTLAWKGSRTYLHGSDLFNALAEIAEFVSGDQSAFVSQLIFKRFARNALAVTTDEPATNVQTIGKARLAFAKLGTGTNLWIIETGDEVTTRRPFDEDDLVATAVVDENAITLSKRSHYSPIEEIIALTKKLNYALSPEVSGRWVFGQIDLSCRLDTDHQITRIERKNIVGNRFSLNEIQLNEKPVGTIRFIVGSP